jgi:hypothetical protein
MKTLFLLFWALIFLVGCQSKPVEGETVTTAGGSYQNVAPAELQTMLKEKDFVFIYIHIPFEGNIPNTDLSMLQRFGDRIWLSLGCLPGRVD